MNLLNEIEGAYARMRVETGSSGPFSSSVMNVLVKIIGYDPRMGVYKVLTDGPKGNAIAYFPRESVNSFLLISEATYVEDYERIEKKTREEEEEHKRMCKDCGEHDEPTDADWYGSLEAIERSLREANG